MREHRQVTVDYELSEELSSELLYAGDLHLMS